MRDNRTYLKDILDAIEQIEKYIADGREGFEANELIQTWVVHHIEIIGEAIRRMSPEFKSLHPEILWSQISAMRNILVHDYFRIDLNEVWLVIEGDIPVLKGQIEEIVRNLENSS